MNKFKIGDKCWILENGKYRPVTVHRIDSNFAVIKFENGGGIRISVNRLLTDKEIEKNELSCIKGYRSPYDYDRWH